MKGWRWWWGEGWYPERLLLAGAVAYMVFSASGFGRPDLGLVWIGFTAWMHLGGRFEYEEEGGWRSIQRPQRPTGRVALAAVMFAASYPILFLRAFDLLVLAPAADRVEMFLGAVLGIALLGGASVLAAAVPRPVNWVIQHNRERQERTVASTKALTQARLQMLQAQLQPHFLFNALNTASALMRDEPARGRDVVLRLRGLMERTWKSVETPTTTVGGELAFVRDQLAIEQERFRDRLRVRFDVPADLHDRTVPALSLQPLVENALKHGIARSIDGGEVVVRVAEEDDMLCMSVADSVAGLDPRWSAGTGVSNLRARLDALYGAAASLTLTTDGRSTVAQLCIPSWMDAPSS